MEEEKKENETPVETESVSEDSKRTTASEAAQDDAEETLKDAKATQDDAEETLKDSKPSEPDWKDLYARLKADFDNYKKRAARDREDVYRYAESDILGDILPTVDNLALALANAKPKEADDSRRTTASEDDPFVKGVQLVYDTLVKALKDHGAEPFDSIGEDLDTEKMEAITMMPSADIAEGKVVAEVKRGWTLKGKTLRAAQVVVSSGKPEEK